MATQPFHGGLFGVIMRVGTVAVLCTDEVESCGNWLGYTSESVTNGNVYRQQGGASLLILTNSYMLKSRGAAREKSPKTSHSDHPGAVRVYSVAGQDAFADSR